MLSKIKPYLSFIYVLDIQYAEDIQLIFRILYTSLKSNYYNEFFDLYRKGFIIQNIDIKG